MGEQEVRFDSNRNGSSPYGYFNGFKITQLLKADGIGNYPAANACISYSPAADAKTSGWFFPAGGQMLELRNTRGELIKKLFSLIIIRADIGNPSKMEVEIRGV